MLDNETYLSNFSAINYCREATFQKIVSNNLIRIIVNYISKKPTQIVEIGCGTGHLTSLLLNSFPEARVIATDVSEDMLNNCHKEFSFKKNLELIKVDKNLQNIPQGNLIASNMAIHWTNIEDSILSLLSLCEEMAFSIPVAGSYENWITLRKNNGLSGGFASSFLSSKEILEIIKRSRGFIKYFRCENFNISFISPYFAAKHMAATGPVREKKTNLAHFLKKIKNSNESFCMSVRIGYFLVKNGKN